MSKRDFQKGAKYFLGLGLGICSKYIRSYSDEGCLKTPNGYSLGGTPLDEAILTAATMVPEFKKSSGAEIVNTIFLTDGESRPAHTYLKRLKEGEATEENVGKLRVRNFNPVRKNGYRRTYSNGARVFIKAENGMQIDIGSGDTSDYLEFLSKVTNTNTIGFYLAPRKWFNKNTRWNLGQDNNNIEEDFRKGSVAISNCDGYDERYFINVDKMLGLEDSNLEGLSDNATKGQIKTAFKKMVNNKLTNRVILNRMINLIAM
jgi:GDP-D-mannose dehydratase